MKTKVLTICALLFCLCVQAPPWWIIPNSTFPPASLTLQGYTIHGQGAPLHTYIIMRSTDFVTWSMIADVESDASGCFEFTDTDHFSAAVYKTEMVVQEGDSL